MRILNHLRKYKNTYWVLGLSLRGIDGILQGEIQWIKDPAGHARRWFADPFILSHNDCQVDVLVEEFEYVTMRGHISHIVIDRQKGEIIKSTPILQLSTHLSFPVIYRMNGKVIVAPENYQSGSYTAYEYDLANERLIPIKQIAQGKFTDTIIHQFGEKFYLFSTLEPNANGSILEIYESEDFFGPYSHFQTVTFDERIARNGGDFYHYKGQLIRPAQYNDDGYGRGLSLQSIEFGSRFSFKEISRIYSPNERFNLGFHTYNEYEGLGIVDVKGWYAPVFGKSYEAVYQILKKIGLRK